MTLTKYRDVQGFVTYFQNSELAQIPLIMFSLLKFPVICCFGLNLPGQKKEEEKANNVNKCARKKTTVPSALKARSSEQSFPAAPTDCGPKPRKKTAIYQDPEYPVINFKDMLPPSGRFMIPPALNLDTGESDDEEWVMDGCHPIQFYVMRFVKELQSTDYSAEDRQTLVWIRENFQPGKSCPFLKCMGDTVRIHHGVKIKKTFQT